MQELTIECDFCARKYALRFSSLEDDPIYCPFCGSGYIEDDYSFEDEDVETEEEE